MRRAPLYSPSSPPARPGASAPGTSAAAATAPANATTATTATTAPPPRRARTWLIGLSAGLFGAALMLALMMRWGAPGPRALTQEDIDRAVLHTLNTKSLPSPAARAYEAIRGSVVKVVGLADASESIAKDKNGKPGKADKSNQRAQPRVERDGQAPGLEEREERGIGTGVVIQDNGTILTNLHVVFGAKRIKVIFADGLESDADVIALRPEHDLAVLRARKIPDDLKAATMRSTHDLRPGDRVTAVGFPFGIGPSVSHGVVSGLKREFRSPEGQRILTNLIQFDAAANPGNSGGPLITDDGEVVGIVTAIYNPTEERFFVGIGFAVPIENAAQAAGMPPF